MLKDEVALVDLRASGLYETDVLKNPKAGGPVGCPMYRTVKGNTIKDQLMREAIELANKTKGTCYVCKVQQHPGSPTKPWCLSSAVEFTETKPHYRLVYALVSPTPSDGGIDALPEVLLVRGFLEDEFKALYGDQPGASS